MRGLTRQFSDQGLDGAAYPTPPAPQDQRVDGNSHVHHRQEAVWRARRTCRYVAAVSAAEAWASK